MPSPGPFRFVDNEQTQRVNVGLLVKKLPARLRHHLSAETLLPVLEQTKVRAAACPEHPLDAALGHPASLQGLASLLRTAHGRKCCWEWETLWLSSCLPLG